MRSRYTAFTRNDEAYLLQSWHPSTRPPALDLTQQAPIKWLGLKLVHTEAGGTGDDTGRVEFSEFVKEAGRWFYVHGRIDD
jgi:SEC-C motif-containing protein